MTARQSTEKGACRVGCGHPLADHENGECMHLCDCAWPAENDALPFACCAHCDCQPTERIGHDDTCRLCQCSCGNRYDGDNLCMVSACQWEGIEDKRGESA